VRNVQNGRPLPLSTSHIDDPRLRTRG